MDMTKFNPKTGFLLSFTALIVLFACVAAYRVFGGSPATPEEAVADQAGEVATVLPPNAYTIQTPVEGVLVDTLYLPEMEIRTLAERPLEPPPPPPTALPEAGQQPEQVIIRETVEVIITATPDPNTNVVVNPPPIQPNNGGIVFIPYTVQQNDTLYGVANAQNSTIELMAQHGIDADDMFAGNVINLPVPNTVSCGGYRTYIVQPGDNTFRLGINFGTNEDVIREINRLDAYYTIYVGQVLCIP